MTPHWARIIIIVIMTIALSENFECVWTNVNAITKQTRTSAATAEIARVGGDSGSFKVTDISTNQKPICNFLLVN